MSYDTKCYELAELFLSDLGKEYAVPYEFSAHELAQEIQNTIEEYLNRPPTGGRP